MSMPNSDSQSLSSNPAPQHLLSRFQRASTATATRAAGLLNSGLSLLSHQLQRPKNSTWQGETAWVLDGLKNNALDGLDAQEALGAKSTPDKLVDQRELTQSGKLAKQALLSSPSPMVGAVELQKHVGGFSEKCVQILSELRSLIDGDRETETQSRRTRSIEKETSGPSKKGI